MIKPENNEIPRFGLKLHTKIRFPTVDKEYVFESRKALKITKVYQPFSLEDTDNTNDQEDIVEKKIEKGKINNEDFGISNNNNKAKEKNKNDNLTEKKAPVKEKQSAPVISANSFAPKELEDPNSEEFLMSVKVLDQRIAELERERDKCEGRCPPELRMKIMRCKAKRNQLEEGVSDGSLNVQQFIEFLQTRLKRDEMLSEYFRTQGDVVKLKIVEGRIPLMKAEINEGLAYLKSLGKA